MKIIIKENYEQLSDYAADIIASLVRNKPDCTLGLATGATPVGTYKKLIHMHRHEGLDFSKVKTFNLDEYNGIGMDLSISYRLDQSYARFMHEQLFSAINVKEKNIHIPNGLAKDPHKECERYEQAIKDAGGIDLQILGIGGDGHWAFNEPGSSFDSRTRIEYLHQKTTDDNYEAFYKKAGIPKDQMPKSAYTMGIATILEAKSILMLVSGKSKADIIQKALEGPVTTQVTASAIQLYKKQAVVVLDRDAASKLTKSLL